MTALVRDEEQASRRRLPRRAGAAIVDLYDRAAVSRCSRRRWRRPHGEPGDETSAKLDSAVVDAAVEAFGDQKKPYAHISGLWVFGQHLDHRRIALQRARNGGLEGGNRSPHPGRVAGARHLGSYLAPHTATAAEASLESCWVLLATAMAT